MFIVKDKSTHEEHLSQPLQTNNKQFRITVLILTDYVGISMSQIQIIGSISRKQLPMEMIFFKLLYHQVLMKLKVWIMKLRGLLLMKVI